jgi:hypothetical protein
MTTPRYEFPLFQSEGFLEANSFLVRPPSKMGEKDFIHHEFVAKPFTDGSFKRPRKGLTGRKTAKFMSGRKSLSKV